LGFVVPWFLVGSFFLFVSVVFFFTTPGFFLGRAAEVFFSLRWGLKKIILAVASKESKPLHILLLCLVPPPPPRVGFWVFLVDTPNKPKKTKKKNNRPT